MHVSSSQPSLCNYEYNTEHRLKAEVHFVSLALELAWGFRLYDFRSIHQHNRNTPVSRSPCIKSGKMGIFCLPRRQPEMSMPKLTSLDSLHPTLTCPLLPHLNLDVILFLILHNTDKVKQGSWASCWLYVKFLISKVNIANRRSQGQWWYFYSSCHLCLEELVLVFLREEYIWPVFDASATHLMVASANPQVFNFLLRDKYSFY